jgi:hypothetical protein
MEVALGVAEAMMVPVPGRPPQRPFLGTAGGSANEHCLPEAVEFESLVRQVAVVDGGDQKPAHYPQRRCQHDQVPLRAKEHVNDSCQANRLGGEKWPRSFPLTRSSWLSLDSVELTSSRVGCTDYRCCGCHR